MKSIYALWLCLVFLIVPGFNLKINASEVEGNDPKYQEHKYIGLVVALHTICDLDRDSHIDQAEWDQVAGWYWSRPLQEDLMAFDADGDELIDINEFRNIFTCFERDQLQEVFGKDPMELVEVRSLEIWDQDNDPKIEKFVAGSYELELDADHN